ncbi:nesprin-1-like, partial [Lucilia sericata]|uniref:nesprin-1-like n=1 Tax=Lucilia sericata TaxID=13632 RepID=UPI0018A80E43
MDKTTDERHEEDPPPPIMGVGEAKRPIPAVRKRRLGQTAVETSSTADDTQPYVSQGQMQQDFETIEEASNTGFVYDDSMQETSSTISRTITKTIRTTTSSSHEYLMEEGFDTLGRPKTPTTPLRLKQKVAIYEKAWHSGEMGGIKRSAEHMSQESIRSSTDATDIDINIDSDNPFDIDVYEIEKRLREERKRGLAEAEAAKLAFQQIQLRATPLSPARKVEIHEEHTASPFNVTLKTTSKISPGAVTGRIELEEHSPKSPFNVTLRTTQRYRRNPATPEELQQASPFNVTLRTTKRHSTSPNPTAVDGKLASARFLEGEKTVREVISADGVKTIVTSSMTSDGRKHEEKIFRHGEGYFSPRASPQREMRATTPSRSVDMTAGGRRILIKLENEQEQMDMYSTDDSFDVTDYKVTSERHFKTTAGGETVTLETPPNIDIIVGTTSNHPKRRTVSLETKHEQMPWQTQQHYTNTSSTSSSSTAAYTTKTTTKITTTSRQQRESLESDETSVKNISISKTIQSQGSTSPEESHRFVTKQTITGLPPSPTSPTVSSRIGKSVTKTTTATHKLTKLENETSPPPEHEALRKRLEIVGYGRDGLGHGTGELGYKTDKLRETQSDDSDTEGATASSIVIVPTGSSVIPASASVATSAITPTKAGGTVSASSSTTSTLHKSLTPTQTQQQQSTTTTSQTSANEYQEIQSTMAAIQFARSNSQYDTHIKEKREEQERVQKKTFTNWINSYLLKRVPPLRVDDLINDLRDGTKLIALLEVLSGEKLPVERGRVLRRPHFLSNANTALQFLASKRIKLVNINPADLVDGRPPVVLGLIWTIILYFQIEENSRNLEYLGHGIGGSVSSLDSVGKNASDMKAEKWKQGARKTLLNWVTNALPKESGVEVKDFGASWRDGVAFLALIDSIKANLVNLAELKKNANNRQRLETAFDVAESKLGIAKLLDAEDVDVPKPDEKSIMTYVAQFLHKYPEPKGASKDFSHIQQEIDELKRFLMEKSAEYEPMVIGNSFPRDFAEYLIARSEIDAHLPTYNRLKQLVESQSGFLQVSRSNWEDINVLWQRVQYQMNYWLWLLDSELPGEFGEVGKWLAEAEKILMDNDIPTAMNEETAAVISRKLEEHKLFFADLPRIVAMFENAKRSPLAQKIPLEQLRNMERRVQEVGPRAAERRIKLKFLEHKCCLVAFLNLVENKMKGWTGKYGTEERVAQQLEQYKNFVSRNKIFQEFQKAFVDMQQVVDEYKRDGNVSRKDIVDIDRFMYDTEERWKRVSLELKCCQNSLEEVVNCWKTWNQLSPECEQWLNLAEQKVMQSEDEKLNFFQDISVWKDKFDALANGANYLIASCEENIAHNLRQQHGYLAERFERLFVNTKKYMHAGDIIRSRQEYKSGIEKLYQWLRSAESILSQKLQLGDSQQIQKYSEDLQKLASEIDDNEELFKNISRNIQGLIQDLSREEVDGMMKTLKLEKEALVRVRAQIPNKLHLIHQLLIQQESLEAGQKEIHQWLNEAESLLSTHTLSGGRDKVNEELNKHKTFFSRTVYYRSMLESKNKVFQNLLRNVTADENIDPTQAQHNMQQMNDRFNYVIQNAQQWEQRLGETLNNWNNFKDNERVVSEWLTQAETILIEKHIETKTTIETQKYFFENVNQRWMSNLVESAQNLLKTLPPPEQKPVVDSVEGLQTKWQNVLSQAPLHLMKLEFRAEESQFHQTMQEVEKELHLEEQALNRNEDVDSILKRNQQFFLQQGSIPRLENSLQNMYRLDQAYRQQQPTDNSLENAYKNAQAQYAQLSNKIATMRETLQQIPAQWESYHEKFNDMVEWMNTVDKSLKNIVNEVNSMEEFEKEKVVFQKICQEADNKREDMKWLVKTLDHLLSYASEEEANAEQKKLEDLIARYKNLIPTIEITMVKTEVFSKCYTYRREVHEVVCLLSKVKEQAANIPPPDSLERVNKLIEEQQYAINQLDHQRPHIMSMLQRGRDLSKDVHAPAFVQHEVKNLETGWNQAYTQTSDKLQALKGTQAVWNEFADQKADICSMLQVAETELRALTPLQTDPKNVSQDLKAKRELNTQLHQASHQLLPKLHALKAELAPLAAAEKRPILEKEVTEVEKMFFNTMEHVKDRVGYLEDYSAKWNNYKSRLAELQEWANKVAPKAIETLHSEDLTPEERVMKVNAFKGTLAERMKQLDMLAADASELAPKEGNIAEAKRLKGEITKLQEVLSAINRNVDHQAQAVQEDLANWQQFQTGIQHLKPIVEESEIKVNTIVPKPMSLEEAVALQQNAKQFETHCLEQLDRLQGISNITHKMLCKTNAPDEVDAMHSRWTTVHENAKQASGKLEKLVSNWKSFENDAGKLEDWIEKGEQCVGKKSALLSTPHVDKLENELVRLKSFNNEISEQQAKLVALGQSADQISLHLAPEGAVSLKDRVNTMKAKLQKLSEATRGNINEISDAIIARQDFNAKMVNFSNWMDNLRSQLAQVEEINPERVETSLHVVHALMQEHNDKKPSFNAIYDEVKQISLGASPEETKALNEAYSALVLNYQNLETNMQQKKVCLEKWTELLNWKHETENHMNYLKHQIEKPEAPQPVELNKIMTEISAIAKNVPYWKAQAKEIDENPVIHLKDALTRKPYIATQIVNDVENKLENLQLRTQNHKQQIEQMQVRKDNFHTLENNMAQALQENRAKLSEILKRKPNLENIDQIIADLVALNDALKVQSDLKNKIHDEGTQLMREDIASMPAIQDTLLHMDKDYDSLQGEIADRIQKYELISRALREYADIKNKFSQEMKKANDLYHTIPQQPRDEVELQQASDKTRKTMDQIRKVKVVLDEFDRKVANIGKLFDNIGEVIPQDIPNDLAAAKQSYQDLHDKTVKNAHMYETEAVIWSQIEDAKKDLMPWLSETNQGLCDAADNSIEIEFAPMRLTKYRSELPSYQALKDTIAEKSAELLKINNNVEIPALTSLNQLLNEQFAEVENNAERLNAITAQFNDQEQDLRKNIKQAGEQVGRLREQLIKCDDMSGDNTKIIERLQNCRALQAELSNTGNEIDNIKQKVDELKSIYPTFSESIIPKELNNVQKRYDGVDVYAKKIENSLLQFLKKFHADKVGMLKRIISTQKEKVAWCQPESSSDKYNLDVKKSSLQEVGKALEDCKKRQGEIANSLEMLKAIESPENIAELVKDADLLNAEMKDLENSFDQIKNILNENVDLWVEYEKSNEELNAWLRDIEGRIKAETSNQINLNEIPKKLQELAALQQDINEHGPIINNLEKTSQQLIAKNPEARIGQFVTHLVQRYQTVAKGLQQYMDKLNETAKANDDYNAALTDATDWLSEAKVEFQELARMGSPGSSSATAQQLQTIKNYLNTFDNGQILLNNAVDIGEAMYTSVTPENREKIRAQLRNLRENFDYLRDEANALMQQVEGVLIQKTTIEESYTQVSHYLNESKAKAAASDELYPTLAAKKAALQNYKVQLQEATLHKNALKQLQEKAIALCDDESERKTEESIKEYNDLSKKITDRIGVVTNQVAKHEAYDQVLEKAQDWLNTIKSEAIDILNETTFEKEGAEEKLIVVENLLQHKPEGDQIFETCQQLLNTVLSQTHPSGHPALLKSFQEPKNAWDEFMVLCEDSLVKLKQLCSKWDEFETIIDEIDNWMKGVEAVVKNQSLKSTAEAKKAHLQQLLAFANDIEKKAKSINDLMDQGREIEGETDLNLKLSRLNTRYQTLKNLCKESIAKYQNYVKDHEAFDQEYEKFKQELQLCIDELEKNKDVVGDQNLLQERQNKLRDMSDKRINDGTIFENLIDNGEKLYGHTSPDGREIIRQQLRNLRTMWDNYTDDLNQASQKIDHCILQFNEFSIAQDQLTKWLKDVDKAMQSHTEPKTTLQEKRAQLQNHKLLHQEITTHNVLVDNVCDKAQALVDQIKDNSLNVYLQSIKQLFNNIVQKSEEILNNLDDCVQKHNDLNNQVSAAKAWISGEKAKLLECDDAYGEKSDIKRKIETLRHLAENKPQAMKIVTEIREQFEKVKPSTSEKGNEVLNKEIDELETTIKSHFDDIEGIEGKQNDVLQQWNNFEQKLDELTKWCRSAEAVFREQQLQSTLHEKVEQLEKYKIQRDLILQKEKEIDAFADAAHALLNNCGADRLKTLTSQITNRYQLLQVLSKEVVNRWSNLVDDHQFYQDKYNEVDLWLQPIEKQLEHAEKEDASQVSNILQVLLSEKEQAETLFAALNAAGEKALPETSTQGREKLRKEMRDIRDRWDKLDEGIRNLQKKQEAQTVQLSSYQDILGQVVNWLDQVEKAIQNENPATWTSAQEIRSKLYKFKTTQQDINSHKRIVEAVNEKATILQNTTQPANAAQIKQAVDDVNKRYEKVSNDCNNLMQKLEESFDVYQQFSELQKAQQDYQKNLWDRLTSYSEYSGNKPALQARLSKIIEIQDLLPEGSQKLQTLSDHIDNNAKILPARSKEAMTRDLSNLHADFEKFSAALSDVKSGLENRLQQWGDYEVNLDQLISWLAESENALKNYNPKSTMEEKEDQLNKFQSLAHNLRQKEIEFEKIKDDSSELIQSSGETRIAVNVQQVTSRFQSIQATTKEILKKCEQAVQDHNAFNEKYKQCSDWMASAQAKYDDSSDLAQVGTREDLLKKQIACKELLAQQPSATLLLNNTIECGEKCYPSTATEGREAIRSQLEELQQTFDQLFDKINTNARKIQDQMSKWSGFDEIAEKLQNWLLNIEKTIPADIELKTTLDEKRAKLQNYRDALNDINNHQAEIGNLQEITANLPEKTEHVEETTKDIVERYNKVQKRAQQYVENYERFVSAHQQYCKAVMDAQEFIESTHSTIDYWGDLDLEQVSLHTNLDRLKNLKSNLADEFPRVDQVRTLGELVIPGTVESGQVNIKSQIDNTQQEWESLIANLNSTIEAIELRLQQWSDYEQLRDQCLAWIRDADNKLHSVDLKAKLAEKKSQLEELKTLQGEVRAKELEIDNVSEKAQLLMKGPSASRSSGPELVTKYQQLFHKVKELNNRWQQYVTSHQEFDNSISEVTAWINGIKEKLDYCSDMSSMNQKELDKKLATIQDVTLMKDEGSAKVLSIVELAQNVLANTAPNGHDAINKELSDLQDLWSSIALRIVDVKGQLDDSITQWSGFLEQIQNVNKFNDSMDATLKELSEYQATMPEKRAQLDRIKSTEEKVRMEKIDVDSLKSQAKDMIASGQQSQQAFQAQKVLDRFDELAAKAEKLLTERQDQYRDHRLYKEAYDDLVSWISRAREKFPSLKQSSLSDKLAIENAVQATENMLNKQAQGELLVEHLTHTGEVVMSSTSPQGQEIIRNDIRSLRDSFESLFRDISSQKENLEETMNQWRAYKEEYERLMEWLQQIDILVKNHKLNLLPNLREKEKQVADMRDIMGRLEKGKGDIEKFNNSAAGLLKSHLDTYVNNQLRHLNSMYQVQVNLAKDVLKKVETNCEQHREFEGNLQSAKDWINHAKDVIREASESSSAGSKELLEKRLEKIQTLIRNREVGQNLVHTAINNGEKVVRNTRSDGRDAINNEMKELQNDWDRLVKKMSTAKVQLETNLLQWADYSSSYTQLQKWIADRESKLQQACEQKIHKSKGAPRLSSGLSERKANLRQTNNIVQDIVSFEPMIQSVTSKASDLQQGAPASEISNKYETLTKQAMELYEKQKNTIDQYQAFIDCGNDFATWLRNAKERLSKCSEPTGDKQALAEKTHQLKILQSEVPEGQKKLEAALAQGEKACNEAEPEDREVIEQEVALLQEEFDTYVDNLMKTKDYLEMGIVKWSDYQDQYTEALDWLTKTEALVQSYNKLQENLTQKKVVLEEFQGHLQTLFDWQKTLDHLNMKAQMLLETCSDTRISNAIMQLTTKYNALLTLAKEVMRRLEMHYQEHQQHHTLYEECQSWIEQTREKLQQCEIIPGTLNEVQIKLNTVKNLRQGFESGQNKLRYLLELKEKVIMNTEQSGAAKIQEDTDTLKQDYEDLLNQMNDVKQKLMNRLAKLEEIFKMYKLLQEWLEDVEPSLKTSDDYLNDLSEKRAALEKFRAIQRDFNGHSDMVEKINKRLSEDNSLDRNDFAAGLNKFDELQQKVNAIIESLENQVNNHDKYKQSLNELQEWLRNTRIEIEQCSNCHGEKQQVEERLNKLGDIDSSMITGKSLLEACQELSQAVISTSGNEGQDSVTQEIKHLSAEWDAVQAMSRDARSNLESALNAWSSFLQKFNKINKWIEDISQRVNHASETENKTPEHLVNAKKLLEEVVAEKDNVEDLNDACELLMEHSACSRVRDQTVDTQANYTKLLTSAQGLVSKIEKNLSDHTEFLNYKNEMDAWIEKAQQVLDSCNGDDDVQKLAQQIETVNSLSLRLPEGQHLLGMVQDAYSKASNVLPEDKQEKLRDLMTKVREDWDALGVAIKQKLIDLKQKQSRWSDYSANMEKLEKWLNEVENNLKTQPDTKGEFSEMKTQLERYKSLQGEIKLKGSELENLIAEAKELGTDLDDVHRLQARWDKVKNDCANHIKNLEGEINDYTSYHQALQDIEKWLLQISFQLMAHNSLFISNRQQTQEQIKQHEALLDEIQKYQANIDELNAKGKMQIKRYEATTPAIRDTVESQLKNIQDSYNSLLQTSVQIRNRLQESLAKFQEYEDTLDSIMRNLEEYEPIIQTELDAPATTLEMAQNQLKCAQNMQNKLNNEKSRLASAVQACEAATASISRPSSPLETAMQVIPERELIVRAKLEDLLDQIPSKRTLNSTKDNDVTVDVELSEVNDILLDAVAHERIQNFKQIIRLNFKLVERLYALNTK